MSIEDLEKPEEMAAFFDVRSAGYDDHMRDNIFQSATLLAQFYRAVSLPIEPTDAPLKILDLGCGTGLETENQLLAEYHQLVADMPPARDGHYHIDVPFSLENQRSLLLEAGFRDFQLVWQKDSSVDWNIAVYVVTA